MGRPKPEVRCCVMHVGLGIADSQLQASNFVLLTSQTLTCLPDYMPEKFINNILFIFTENNTMMKISIGSDHAGYELKEVIIKYLNNAWHKVENEGPFSSESVDYPDYAHKTARKVNDGNCDMGILICGTGNGVSMTANKHINVRAALCWNVEIAKLAREHNDANILALPARFITKEDTLEMVKVFLETKFEGGRHQKRIEKIKNL